MILEDGKVTCPSCDWRGREEDADEQAEADTRSNRILFKLICPRCGHAACDVCDELGCWKIARCVTLGRNTCPDHRPPLTMGAVARDSRRAN